MKILGYEINNTFLSTIGAVIVLIILACTVWDWFWIPAALIVGLIISGLIWVFAYQKWGSP